MESHLFQSTWQHPISQQWTDVLDINMNHWSHFFWTIQGAPRIAFSSTMCNFLLLFSRYSIALNLIFTAYTFSPIFPNFLSLLSQMEPTPSQVRNHYSQKNQEAHLEKALAFNKEAKFRSPSTVCLPLRIVHCVTDDYCPRFHYWSRMTIPIRSSVMVRLTTLQSPPYPPTSKKMIWINNNWSCFWARRTGTSSYELQGFHCQSNRAVPIQLLHTLRFQIAEIHLA